MTDSRRDRLARLATPAAWGLDPSMWAEALACATDPELVHGREGDCDIVVHRLLADGREAAAAGDLGALQEILPQCVGYLLNGPWYAGRLSPHVWNEAATLDRLLLMRDEWGWTAAAARAGHVRVLQWLAAHRFPLTDVARAAVRGSHLDVLDWLETQSPRPWAAAELAKLEFDATIYNQSAVLQWVQARRGPLVSKL